jgi:hypothetical protein
LRISKASDRSDPQSARTARPARGFNLTQERSPRDCPGPASSRLDYKAYPKLAIPQYQDGKGNFVLPFGDRNLPVLNPLGVRPGTAGTPAGCGPGIRVQIPANALVDEGGNPPTGNVQVAPSTVDLISPEQMPATTRRSLGATPG